MNKQPYPRIMPLERRVNNEAVRTCEQCGQPIPKKATMYVREIQVDWLRGNDETHFFHVRCKP